MLRFMLFMHTTATLRADEDMVAAAGCCEGCGDAATRTVSWLSSSNQHSVRDQATGLIFRPLHGMGGDFQDFLVDSVSSGGLSSETHNLITTTMSS